MIRVKDIWSKEQAEYAIKRKGGYFKIRNMEVVDLVVFFDDSILEPFKRNSIIGNWDPQTYTLFIY